MTGRHCVWFSVALLSLAACARADDTPAQLFERRILPIFRSPNPSSCTECHLSGVQLKDYLLPTHEQSFLSLRDQGLIDMQQPEESHILKLIARSSPPTGKAALSAKAREQELAAFSAWIKACVADANLAQAPALDASKRARPRRSDEIIRHARKDALLESFENTIWAMRFRCMNCHSEGSPQNSKLVAEQGEQVAWMKQGGAAETLDYLLASKLIDRQRPERSLLLLKPLNEIKHGGGVKFAPGDQGYQAFRAWLEDAAKTLSDKYTTAAQLPPASDRVYFGSEIWLKLANTPERWGKAIVQADVYAWDEVNKRWSSDPIASTDRTNNPMLRVMQHTLTLATAKDSELAKQWSTGAAQLPSGRYLARVYVDSGQRRPQDWRVTLGPKDFAGETEFQATWRTGYSSMTTVDAAKLAKP